MTWAALDLFLAGQDDAIQTVRFWLALANLAWLLPVAVASVAFPHWVKLRFPQAALAIPASGLMIGLAGFSAHAAFGFDPTPSWRAILSLWIGASLVLFLAMGLLRWWRYDL